MKDDMPQQQTTELEQGAAGPPVQEQDLTGKTFGDFHLLRCLGQGGMGKVYLAEQLSLKRKVAVKMLRSDLAANETALKRFKAEATAVARATHANIVQVYFIGQQDGLHYMALEYVEGRTLRDYLEKKGPPDVLQSITIMAQVAAALQRAGELGIIHRDIKPDNILITRKDEVKVTDFGLSRIFGDQQQPLNLTQSGVTMGTPLYMSPEQVEGKPLDPRTDIYSLGVTAYHLLAGQPPFRGQSAFEIAVQHVQKEPPPLQELRPDLPAPLCDIVRKMMAKQPEDRYQTAQEIIRDLGQLRDVLVGVSSTMPQIETNRDHEGAVRAAHEVSGFPRSLTVAALVLVMIVAGLGLGWWINRGMASLADAPDEGLQSRDRQGAGNVVSAINPLEEKEKILIERFKEFDTPDSIHDIRKGMDACTELGLFYLKHRAHKKYFEEAEHFFDDLARRDAKHPYQYFGQLGQAIVLAFKGEAKASNDRFLDVLTPPAKKKPLFPKQGVGKAYWMSYPPVREMVALALHHNLENLKKDQPNLTTFPPGYERLEAFRRPPGPMLRDGRKETSEVSKTSEVSQSPRQKK